MKIYSLKKVFIIIANLLFLKLYIIPYLSIFLLHDVLISVFLFLIMTVTFFPIVDWLRKKSEDKNMPVFTVLICLIPCYSLFYLFEGLLNNSLDYNSLHYKLVVCVNLLFLAVSLFIITAEWLKKKYDIKKILLILIASIFFAGLCSILYLADSSLGSVAPGFDELSIAKSKKLFLNIFIANILFLVTLDILYRIPSIISSMILCFKEKKNLLT